MTQQALEDWIGREERREDRLTAGIVARMHATLGLDGQPPVDGDAIPPAWHWLLFAEAKPPAELGRDGHPKRGGFLPPVPLPRRMWAGGRLEFAAPLCVGETITRRSTIADVTQKSGKSGDLCFVTVHHEFSSGGAVCLREEHDIVYRDDPAPEAPAPQPPDAPGDADITETVTPGPVLLFRYSALTFNGHRIHYDVDYCRDVEGYPGLVFHGPLTATMLLALAERVGGMGAVAKFSFRAVSPLFETAPFTIACTRDGAVMSLWAANPDGKLAMSAEAEVRAVSAIQ